MLLNYAFSVAVRFLFSQNMHLISFVLQLYLYYRSQVCRRVVYWCINNIIVKYHLFWHKFFFWSTFYKNNWVNLVWHRSLLCLPNVACMIFVFFKFFITSTKFVFLYCNILSFVCLFWHLQIFILYIDTMILLSKYNSNMMSFKPMVKRIFIDQIVFEVFPPVLLIVPFKLSNYWIIYWLTVT